jgi:uroporphyrinogen-III synthase
VFSASGGADRRVAEDSVSADAPLRGLRVAVTRPVTKGDRLATALARWGATVIEAPAIRLAPPVDPAALAWAAQRIAEYDWVIVTSVAGVEALSAALRGQGVAAVPRRLGVVGSRTEAAAREAGWRVDLVPERFDAEGLLEVLDRDEVSVAGARVLLPLAEGARDVLREGLTARGAEVQQVVAYRSVASSREELAVLERALADGQVDLLTFTSASAAHALREALGAAACAVPVAAVGPVTASAATALGYRVEAVAEEHTMDGLAEAVRRWWASR